MTATLASAARRLKCRAARGIARRRRFDPPALLLVTDAARLPDPAEAILRLPRGSGVVFRHYAHPDRAELARDIARLCRRRGLLFFVGGDARLALAVKAKGLHLREADLARPVLPSARRLVLTASVHSRRALVAAWRKGADAALLGPVFATASHPGRATLGPLRFAALVRESPIPVYAIGGIEAGNAARLLASQAAGIAALEGLARPGQGELPRKSRSASRSRKA